MWCRVHYQTLTPTHKWTPLFSHRETPWNTAWQQQNKDCMTIFSKFWGNVTTSLIAIKPSLNTQADSIRAKLFTWHFSTFFLFVCFYFSYYVSYLRNYTHWTRKYFMYRFKFFIFVLHLILFHFSTWQWCNVALKRRSLFLMFFKCILRIS